LEHPNLNICGIFLVWLLVEDGLTVTPSDAKYFGFEGFDTIDDKYGLACINDDNDLEISVYADKERLELSYRAVTIKGTTDYGYTKERYDVSLMSYNEATDTSVISVYNLAQRFQLVCYGEGMELLGCTAHGSRNPCENAWHTTMPNYEGA
jgi:hypothetical protein